MPRRPTRAREELFRQWVTEQVRGRDERAEHDGGLGRDCAGQVMLRAWEREGMYCHLLRGAGQVEEVDREAEQQTCRHQGRGRPRKMSCREAYRHLLRSTGIGDRDFSREERGGGHSLPANEVRGQV